MPYKLLSKLKAEELLIDQDVTSDYLISLDKSKETTDLRVEFRKISNRIKMKQFGWKGDIFDVSKIKNYTYDLEFGLGIYELLSLNETYKITYRQAANPEFWSHLSILVIPDLVEERWDLANLPRYYLSSSRIWLYTLWWYIHLSWQGDVDSTRSILQNNSTDTILNLVERVGRKGYNLEFTRSLMREHSKVKATNLERPIFRSIMVSHSLMSQTIDPALYKDGVDGYIGKLFDMAGLQKKQEIYVPK